MITRALICGLISMGLSYFFGISRERALGPLVTTMALSILIPAILRPTKD